MESNDQFSIYRMENNTFLGDSLCVVYKASPAEIKLNGLTGPDIAIYIKTPKDISQINSVVDIQNKELFAKDKNILLRLASECQFGTFGDSHCDCESQRVACLEAIKSYGQGVYIQLPQEGQGQGLFYKAKELQLQVHGIDPLGKFVGKKDIYEASNYLTGTSNVDKRKFSVLQSVFSTLKLNRYKYMLISSNPHKAEVLSKQLGISLSGSQDVKREMNIDNVGEYLAKIYKKSFALSDEDLRQVYGVLFNAKNIPDRASSLLQCIKDDLHLGREFNVNQDLLQKIANLGKAEKNQTPVNILDASKENNYREFQIELLVKDDDVGRLIQKGLLGSLSDIAFEQNYFYDLVYFKNTVTRDLKIRRKSKISGKHELIESRLIYKALVADNEYDIKNITINDREVADLLSSSLEGYEVYYVPVFTHTCEQAPRYPELLMLVKRYSRTLKTLSIMGDKNRVESFIDDISKLIEIEITPDPTNIRTINSDLSLDFDYDSLAEHELAFFKENFKG